MTSAEIEIAIALGQCTFLPRSPHKRFARNMAEMAQHRPMAQLSRAQRRYLTELVHRYRAQIPLATVESARAERMQLHLEDNQLVA